MRIFLRFLENIIYGYYNRVYKKRGKISASIFSVFQLFSEGKLYTFHRRRLYDSIVNTLDLNSKIDSKVYSIATKSYVKLFDLNSAEVKRTIEYFYKQKIYNSHIPINESFPNKLITIEDFLNTDDYNYGSFDIETSLNSEVIRKICFTESIWQIAKKYLNSNNVKIYSVNTMLTKQSKKKNYVVSMHKDYDSAGSLVFFVYWTDVSKINGATKILTGDHLFLPDKRGTGYIGEPLVDYLEGKGGSVFALDAWASHAGNPNITSPRLVSWIRFSSMPAKGYYLDNNYLFKNKLEEVNRV